MKIKNKGKVYPSLSSSATSPESDALSVLKLLPAAILALASLLSLEDREVLAYLITRSLKTTTNNPSSAVQDSKRKPSKRPSSNASAAAAAKAHKPPVFECECFDCYTSYWFRWDSSPNRELINQAIEAFEDHLANGEKSKKTTRGKRRDKTGRRVVPNEKPLDLPPSPSPDPPMPEISSPESVPVEEAAPSPSPSQPNSPARSSGDVGKRLESEEPEEMIGELPEVVAAAAEKVTEAEKIIVMSATSHKGLARKVLPDVLGLFNSRLWSLWNPNV